MRIFVVILALMFTFTSTASYAAVCCIKAESAKHDCHAKHQSPEKTKKCAFECSLNFTAKTLNNQVTLSSPKVTSQFSAVYVISNYKIIQKGQERPPKQSV
jgi:hypothetical protein